MNNTPSKSRYHRFLEGTFVPSPVLPREIRRQQNVDLARTLLMHWEGEFITADDALTLNPDNLMAKTLLAQADTRRNFYADLVERLDPIPQ